VVNNLFNELLLEKLLNWVKDWEIICISQSFFIYLQKQCLNTNF
jgi:hypothetical protein